LGTVSVVGEAIVRTPHQSMRWPFYEPGTAILAILRALEHAMAKRLVALDDHRLQGLLGLSPLPSIRDQKRTIFNMAPWGKVLVNPISGY
jgi:hypothetical protein